MAGSDVPAPGVLGCVTIGDMGSNLTYEVPWWRFGGVLACSGKPRGGRWLDGGHAARWVWGSAGGNRPDRLGAGTGGAGGLKQPRHRRSTWPSSRSLSPGPLAAVTGLKWPRHSHTLCHWPLFSGCPNCVSGTERFRWHGRIPVAPVVRKGEPALSSPGRCPAGAAVTHGPGGWGQRLARPTWSQHGPRVWDEKEGLNSQISALVGGLCRDPVVLYPGIFGLEDANTLRYREFGHQDSSSG